MRKNHRLLSALALFLLIPMLATEVTAASSSEIKSQINSLKDEQTAVREQIEELEREQDSNWESIEEMVAQKDNIDRQIALLYAQIENLNSQIRVQTELIAANQEELDEAEAKLAELTEKNQERIQAMEEEGEVSFWSVLFKAKSFTELIDQLNMIEEIQQADQRRMSELSEAAVAVMEARVYLAEEKAGLEESRSELLQTQTELDEKRTEADRILAELNADHRALEQLEADYEAEEAELSAQIAAAEVEYTKALKAEEERRRKEEEERKKQEAANKNPGNSGGNTGDSGNSGGSFVSGESWGRPCSWRKLTSPYGYRTHPITGQWKFHNGVDLANSMGTPIYAARSGIVTVATHGKTYGEYVTINHGDGYSSLYAHMTHYVVSKGQHVTKGQLIGYMGTSGRSNGPHLHFSIFYNGSSVNPMNYI